jgi:dihydropteroate synthase
MAATLNDILNSHRTRTPVLAGIVNVTPDSFSDGGQFFDPADAVAHARNLVADGADILDLGAESTRPGAQRVIASDQIDRLRDVLRALRDCPAVISVDTTLAEVADFAIANGATIINDISAGREDPEMLKLVARHGCGYILMHMLGEPATMQQAPRYADVVAEVRDFLAERLGAAAAAGIDRSRCIVDPGIGFGKKLEHNLALLSATDEIASLSCPVMIGASRKRFIGELTGQADASKRIWGTVGACLAAWHRGATIFRVHDVAELWQALRVAAAIDAAGR